MLSPRLLLLATLFTLSNGVGQVSNADDQERFFETQIRPIIAVHCLECHGPGEQSGELRLDSKDHLLNGGKSGPTIIPGKPDTSRLIEAVRRSDDLAMPPDAELTPRQIAALEHWVRLGAPWPETTGPITDPKSDATRDHWAFQPVRDIDPPNVDSNWPRNPVDGFVISRLKEQQLTPSATADARTLIRRVTMGLTGLPPSPDDVDAFIADDNPKAWESLVDRLLESSAYGEQWARHWLDIARYSDTKGYIYAREERKWVHAWSYRDWVINAINNDVPYDRFLLLQLAADQVPDRQPDDLAAMGFLTVGRRFLGVTRDIIDDRIDTITRGTMGLTVACARCHDHKYDPIPTADYYALYGVLHSSEEKRFKLPSSVTATAEWEMELDARQEKFQTRYDNERQIASERSRDKITEYLQAQDHLETIPAQGFDQVLLPTDVLPEFARRWDDYLRTTKRSNAPVFGHWHTFAQLPADQYDSSVTDLLKDLNSKSAVQVNPRIAAAFVQPPANFAAVIDIYATVLSAVRDEWRQELAAAKAANTEVPVKFSDRANEQLRQVLYGPESPCEITEENLVHSEYLFTSDVCRQLWELQKNVDRWIISAPHQPRYALTLADRSIPSEPRVFRRGNPKTPGADVPRGFLSVLANDATATFEFGSGRLELAQAIIDPTNPLTARVIVNRVWAWHFGKGLVATPSDFGVRADQPTHPDLLDWLTKDFIEHGWSLKHLQRRILLSATYRQSSAEPMDAELSEQIRQNDPSNRLLWRMPLHRLTFEEFRDSILTVAQELDQQPGGHPDSLFGSRPSLRRTIYGEIDRQFFPTALRVFDVANPDMHIPRRSETTVPQQALFYLNHSMVQNRARKLAASTRNADSAEARVNELFRRILQRPPQPDEIPNALTLIKQASATPPPSIREQAKDWTYRYGTFNEEQGSVADDKPIPHFTGSAWQGGPKHPDATLGWVQLTADGGHPGNDRQHACIRRWTAPRDMTITIASHLVHEPKPGDGIRAFIVSNRAGLLAEQKIHQQEIDLNPESRSVITGENIDFVVDIGDGLNSDQHLWEITIQQAGDEGLSMVWNSKTDFTGPIHEQLKPWEQLAQVLLCSNEFLFVD